METVLPFGVDPFDPPSACSMEELGTVCTSSLGQLQLLTQLFDGSSISFLWHPVTSDRWRGSIQHTQKFAHECTVGHRSMRGPIMLTEDQLQLVRVRNRNSAALEWGGGTKCDFWSTFFLILLWIITASHYGLFLTTASLWASSHHTILFSRFYSYSPSLAEIPQGKKPTPTPHPQLLSNYFSYPISPAIPLKAFLSLISPDGPTFFLLLLLRCICLPVYLMSSSLLHDCLRLKMIARVQRRIRSSSLCNFYFENKYYL